MFKGYIPAGTYTAGTNIPITQSVNSNDVYQLTNNTISITKAGVTDIKATIVVEALSAAVLSAQVVVNGTALPNAVYSITTEIGSTYTLVIDYPLLISSQSTPEFVTVALQLNDGATLVSGNVNMEYRE